MWLMCCSVLSSSSHDTAFITNVTPSHATGNHMKPWTLLFLLLWSLHLTGSFWCFLSFTFHLTAPRGTAQVISHLKRRAKSDNQSKAELLMSKTLCICPRCRWQKVGRWQSLFSNLRKNCPPALRGTYHLWLAGEVPCCAQEKWSYFCRHTASHCNQTKQSGVIPYDTRNPRLMGNLKGCSQILLFFFCMWYIVLPITEQTWEIRPLPEDLWSWTVYWKCV